MRTLDIAFSECEKEKKRERNRKRENRREREREREKKFAYDFNTRGMDMNCSEIYISSGTFKSALKKD